MDIFENNLISCIVFVEILFLDILKMDVNYVGNGEVMVGLFYNF